jgi:gas vesicle protein
MNKFRQFAAIIALLLGVALNAVAQVGTGTNTSISPSVTKRDSDGRILQPQTTPSPTAAGVNAPRLERNALPPEIKDKVKQFETAREAFIRKQEELRRQLDGARTDKERESVRAHIKDNLDQWRDQARQFRDEARERAKELQRELPNLREALDDAPKGTPGRPGRPGLD